MQSLNECWKQGGWIKIVISLALMPSANMNKSLGIKKKNMYSKSCNYDASPIVPEWKQQDTKIIFICSDAQSIFNQMI